MVQEKIIQNFKKYQKTAQKRANHLRWFEKIMVYRTTKTENPQTTLKIVEQVLRKTAKSYGR